MSARHCRRHSRRRDGGASHQPASTIASSRRRMGPSGRLMLDLPGPERDRFEILVALQRGGESGGTGGGEIEVAAWRALVAARRAGVFPPRRQVAERFELVE